MEISGLCTYPEGRAGERYDVTLIAAAPDASELTLKIKSLQECDKNGSPRYKKLKSGMYPVYKKPPPIGFMDKVRGKNHFTLWLWVSPLMVTDSLITLAHYQPAFMSIHEFRIDRKWQVHSFSI